VYDEDHVMYLRNVMTQLQRATNEGVPVKGKTKDWLNMPKTRASGTKE